jgi:hypothetical protein
VVYLLAGNTQKQLCAPGFGRLRRSNGDVVCVEREWSIARVTDANVENTIDVNKQQRHGSLREGCCSNFFRHWRHIARRFMAFEE